MTTVKEFVRKSDYTVVQKFIVSVQKRIKFALRVKSELFIERHTVCNATILFYLDDIQGKAGWKTLCLYLQYCLQGKQSKKL